MVPARREGTRPSLAHSTGLALAIIFGPTPFELLQTPLRRAGQFVRRTKEAERLACLTFDPTKAEVSRDVLGKPDCRLPSRGRDAALGAGRDRERPVLLRSAAKELERLVQEVVAGLRGHRDGQASSLKPESDTGVSVASDPGRWLTAHRVCSLKLPLSAAHNRERQNGGEEDEAKVRPSPTPAVCP